MSEQNAELALTRAGLQLLDDAVLIVDVCHKIRFLNRAAERLFEVDFGQMVGQSAHPLFEPFTDVVTGEPPRRLFQFLGGESGRDIQWQCLLENSAGRHLLVQATRVPAVNLVKATAYSVGAVIMFKPFDGDGPVGPELPGRRHDDVTRLFNRVEFELRLRQLINCADGNAGEHVLLYLDVDQFRMINEICGHRAGDRLLAEVGALILHCTRTTDVVARVGNDEFALLLPGCNVSHARGVAEKIIGAMDEYCFRWYDKLFNPTVSIGLVPIRHERASFSSVLKAADVACHQAKALAGSCMAVQRPDHLESDRHCSEGKWVTRIHQALAEDRFCLFRQKIVALGPSQGLERWEVLIRMIDDTGEIVAPGRFLPAAERFGLITPIDRWVMAATFKRLAQSDRQSSVLYSVNVSGASVSNTRFGDYVVELMHNTGVNPRSLCFELTETAAISHMIYARHFFQRMRELGASIALDDFGAGMSSFAYLKWLEFDYLKISGMFIRNLTEQIIDRAFVEAIQRVASISGLRTVAESVETDDIADCLRDMAIDFGQGYALHRPERWD